MTMSAFKHVNPMSATFWQRAHCLGFLGFYRLLHTTVANFFNEAHTGRFSIAGFTPLKVAEL